MDNFIGREIDMLEIMKLVNKNRLVTIKGSPGIGKTSLAKDLSSHIYNRAQRDLFRDGVVYIGCLGISITETLVSKITAAMRIK